jgi:hypothetical protein
MSLASLRTLNRSTQLPEVGYPYDLPSLAGWWDMSSLAGLSDTDAVSSWPDLVGSADLDQSTSGYQPQYRVIGGVPRIRFDGTDDHLQASSAPAFTSAGYTFMVVFSFVATPGNGDGILQWTEAGGTDNGSANGMSTQYVSGNVWALKADPGGGAPLVAAGFDVSDPLQALIVTFVNNTRAWGGRYPELNVTVSSNTWSTGTPTGLLLGARWVSGAVNLTYCPNIDVAEVAMWQSSFTVEEVERLGLYVRMKYGYI